MKFARIRVIGGGHKAHLTVCSLDRGPANIALCGTLLPDDKQRGSPEIIAEPRRDECETCLMVGGFKRRSRKRRLDDSAVRQKALTDFAKTIWKNRIPEEIKLNAIAEARKLIYTAEKEEKYPNEH